MKAPYRSLIGSKMFKATSFNASIWASPGVLSILSLDAVELLVSSARLKCVEKEKFCSFLPEKGG